MSWIVEKIDVSSAKSFTFEVIPSERSLMCTKKRRGPKIEPRETPALMPAHSNYWPLRRTLWNLSLKKLSIRFTRLPEIPIDSSLNNKPIFQTLSAAFEIFKNTDLISRVGLRSNDEKVLWIISIKW